MVNTFVLDGSELAATFRALDDKRLGKQRVEARQIVDALEAEERGETYGWRHHPAVAMWRGHTHALKLYFNEAVREWIRRGFSNTMPLYEETTTTPLWPAWMSFQPLIWSHQAALLRKNSEHYEPLFGNTVPSEYRLRGYLWPPAEAVSNPTHEMYHETPWNLERWLAPLGAGTPAQYRISLEEANAWSQNTTVNPRTGRKITPNGPIYRDYMHAYQYYARHIGGTL